MREFFEHPASALAAVAAIVAAVICVLMGRLSAAQRRQHQVEVALLRTAAQLDLIAVSAHADRYALEGVGQPGTQAVRTLHPGFDFTMNGRYPDRPLRNTDNVVYAPWSEEEVESLEEYQDSGTSQPYVCGLDSGHGRLVPTVDGWECRVCAHTRRWALRYVTDGSWRVDRDRLVGTFARPRPQRAAPGVLPRRLWLGFVRDRLRRRGGRG